MIRAQKMLKYRKEVMKNVVKEQMEYYSDLFFQDPPLFFKDIP